MSLELTALTMADTDPVALTEQTSIVMMPLATATLARVSAEMTRLLSALNPAVAAAQDHCSAQRYPQGANPQK